jgi:hypothetical protein
MNALRPSPADEALSHGDQDVVRLRDLAVAESIKRIVETNVKGATSGCASLSHAV